MNAASSLALVCGLALTVSDCALASTTDRLREYHITTTTQTPDGDVVTREALALGPDGDRYRLSIATGDGSLVSTPVALTSGGAIATDSQDGAVTCYNMAASVLASERTSDAEPAAVYVLFGSSVVRIPLDVHATHTEGHARTVALTGQSTGVFTNGTTSVQAGVIINASVSDAGGNLRDASFDELHYLGSVSHVVGHSTCRIESTTPRAVTQT